MNAITCKYQSEAVIYMTNCKQYAVFNQSTNELITQKPVNETSTLSQASLGNMRVSNNKILRSAI